MVYLVGIGNTSVNFSLLERTPIAARDARPAFAFSSNTIGQNPKLQKFSFKKKCKKSVRQYYHDHTELQPPTPVSLPNCGSAREETRCRTLTMLFMSRRSAMPSFKWCISPMRSA